MSAAPLPTSAAAAAPAASAHSVPEAVGLTVSQIGSRGIPGHRGGVERVVEAVAPRLAALGLKVRVYCAAWSPTREATYRGVELVYVPGLKTKHLDTIVRSAAATMRDVVRRSDIVHLHGSGSAPLALLARLAGRKTVVTIHGLDWQRRKWGKLASRALLFGERAAVRWPHKAVVVSPDLKTMIEERYGHEVTYIPNGVEPRTPRAPKRILEMGLEPRRFTLYLARLVPEKQVHTLIEAWKRLPAEARAGRKLAIAGPRWHSEDYYASLVALADNDPSILFTGEVDEDTLEELYSNCECYVLPSEVEGMSLSLLDAMAFGCCVVTSDIPQNLFVIADAGLSFRVGDADDLSRVLADVIAEPERNEKLRERARARMTEEFSWDRIAERWARLYAELARS